MSDRVTYTAVLPLSRASVGFVADHLFAHRAALGTRTGRRVLDCFDQGVLAAHDGCWTPPASPSWPWTTR